ncbi:DEAD/DEAH box helicase-like protein [Calycina marina]|uniref:DEAD/DEAH box helicase-like protein n=1 Tax=Calycina marina TaxID=1763456 RepID=A0A9P8CFS2_9HELO|nr:DEAD/DEAH box helicase-like protein [Calycina marina]
MPLKAATVSNQVVSRKRKRKRKADEPEPLENPSPSVEAMTTTATLPTKTHDGGPKPRRTSESRMSASRTLTSNSSSFSGPVTATIPWPASIVELEKTHRALNLVFTFCCTRKYLATTFETMKSAVEGHIKRDLLIEDVARIVSLRPGGMRFLYLNEAMLEVEVRGNERDDTFKGSRTNNWHAAGPAPDMSVGGHTGKEGIGESIEHGKEVLLFEFVDGDLKRQVTDSKTREATKATKKLKNEDLKMPVYSQKQMMGLIEKRNTKFGNAINAFLNRCAEENVGPEKALSEQSEEFVPVPTESRSNTPKPGISIFPACIPKERASIPEIIKGLKASEWYTDQIVPDGHRIFDPQEPIYGDLNFQLSQDLVNALYNTKNITQLYAHQAEAINNLHDGHHVIVSTSTSSGKSLIYQIPVLHELERDDETRAMYIFPTKALAQDQRRSLKEMMKFMTGLEETIVETFDGDTEMSARNLIREKGRIIFTNPDMLHITILPQEEKWRMFLKNLKYVVVDEIHVYNGLFGSHVALIMRRLRRICAAVGNRHIKFISCSATVANPIDHFKTIFGIDNVKMTDFDGSPSGRKEFLCWNTPYKDPKDSGSGRGNAMEEAARLFCQLILRGVRVIAFCRVRKGCEALINTVKNELATLERPEVQARVMGYRGGYTPQDRRKIEREMFEGKLMGIVATTALELGVDIGSLDAVITVGFPYSIANLRQQSGRAGRRNKDSLSVLIGDCFPTDQYYMNNPDEIFTKPNCELQVDLQNMLVLEGHLQCAAFEMPIRPDEDSQYFPKNLAEIAKERMVKDDLGFFHSSDRFRPYPSKFVAIRDTEEEHFAIVNISNGQNIVLEELEASRAFFTLYDGGIFLHQGNTYLVKEFNPTRKIAKVEKVNVNWTTQQRDYTDVDPIETEAIRRIPASRSRAYYGTIKIEAVVYGFFKIDAKRRILDAVEVDNPPIIRFSKGVWLDVPKAALDILSEHRLSTAGAIHAAEHAVLSLMPNFVVSMPGDVRTECKVPQKEFAKKETTRKRPARLQFYDAKGGASGSGISTKAFEFIDLLLKQAVRRVEACACEEGCVECVASELCDHSSEVMSKAGAEVVLRSLLGMKIDVDSVPYGPEEDEGIVTVCLAEEVAPARGKRVVVLGEEPEVQVKEEPGD